MFAATLTSKGQMTLPSKIRKALDLGPGDKVELVLEPDATVTMRKKSRSFEELRGLVTLDGASGQISDWVEAAREAMATGKRE